MTGLIRISTLVLFLMMTKVCLPEQTLAHNLRSVLSDSDTLLYLNIPPRSEDALKGSEFVSQVTGLSIENREKAIIEEILSGNVPSFSRKLREIKSLRTINNVDYELIYFSLCDYMAIGSDEDYFYTPMTPSTAQYLADQLNCSLPTKKIVDAVYSAAEVKLDPQPIPPSNKMTTIPVFRDHTDSIKKQFDQKGIERLTDNIIGGHKKDIIISNKIYSTDRNFERVVIYGWHLSVGNPIQPVYNGHIAEYADYSHGVRLISNYAVLDNDSVTVAEILQDSDLYSLISSEGVISKPYYPKSDIFTSIGDHSSKYQMNYFLDQNYPNPFNPSTMIKYTIPGKSKIKSLSADRQDSKGKSGKNNGFIPSPSTSLSLNSVEGSDVVLKIYDILGREVATLVNETQKPGNYEVEFHGDKLTSGIYYYQLTAGDFRMCKKMMMIK